MKRIIALVAVLMLLTTGAAFAGEKVELEYFNVKSEVVTVMQQIIDDFMAENPDIHITLTAVSDAETVLLTRIATNDVPDIMQIYPAEITYKTMYDEGYLMDVTNQPFIGNVSEALLKMTEYKGVQFCLPMTLSTYGIYYRTDIFEKLGIAEPTTYAELIDACKALKDNGYDAFALPNGDLGNVAQRFERGMGVMDNDIHLSFEKIAAGEMTVAECEGIRAFAQFCLGIQPYSTADSMGLDYESAMADMVNGKAAMMFSGTWMLSSLQAADPNIQVKLMPIPSPLYDERMIPVNVDTSFAVNAETKHPEAALKFVEYLSRPEVAQKYYEVDGNINLIKGVEYDKAQMMEMKELVDQGHMFLTQVNFWPAGFRSELESAAQMIYVNGDMEAWEESFAEAIDLYYND